jgi:hypothetical protein
LELELRIGYAFDHALLLQLGSARAV